MRANLANHILVSHTSSSVAVMVRPPLVAPAQGMHKFTLVLYPSILHSEVPASQLKPKVHYTLWSETCSRTQVRGQVRSGLRPVATFLGHKASLGQDSTIMPCLDSSSRSQTGSLCFRPARLMDFRNDQTDTLVALARVFSLRIKI